MRKVKYNLVATVGRPWSWLTSKFLSCNKPHLKKPQYLCEWCHPEVSDFVANHPEKCKICLCPKCNFKTWHGLQSNDEVK